MHNVETWAPALQRTVKETLRYVRGTKARTPARSKPFSARLASDIIM